MPPLGAVLAPSRLPAPALGRARASRRLGMAVRRRGVHEAGGVRRASSTTRPTSSCASTGRAPTGGWPAWPIFFPCAKPRAISPAPFAFFAFGTPGRAAGPRGAERSGRTAAFKTVMALMGHGERLKEAGYPSDLGRPPPSRPSTWWATSCGGRKGVMLDMYRYPEKLEAAAEKILPMAIEMGIRGARMSGNPRVFVAIHGGVEGFMSVEQYKRFYWPTLQALLVALADAGSQSLRAGGRQFGLRAWRSWPTSRPARSATGSTTSTCARAKEVLRGKACIAGNVPIALLTVGTPDDVRAYCKDLIDTVGRDGGFILGAVRPDRGREDRERQGHGGLHQGVRRVDRQRAGATPGGGVTMGSPVTGWTQWNGSTSCSGHRSGV